MGATSKSRDDKGRVGSTSLRRRKVGAPRKRLIKEPVVDDLETSFGRESVSVLLLVFGVFLGAALYSHLSPVQSVNSDGFTVISGNWMGPLGEVVASLLISLLGYCSFVTVLWALLLARTVWVHGGPKGETSFFTIFASVIASIFMAAASAAIASVLVGQEGGGRIGSKIAFTLIQYVNEAGTLLICCAILFLSFGIGTGVGVIRLFSLFRAFTTQSKNVAADSLFVSKGAAGLIGRGAKRSGGLTLLLFKHLAVSTLRACVSIVKAPYRFLRWLYSSDIEADENHEFELGEIDEAEIGSEFVLGAEDEDVISPRNARRGRANRELKISRGEKRLEGRGESKRPTGKIKQQLRKTINKNRIRRELQKDDSGLQALREEALKEFELPPHDLLVHGDSSVSLGPKDDELIRNSQRLEAALRDFRIGGKIIEVHPGPIITLYQFEPAAGIKVQKVVNLADDLALSLKVASVRVYAPVPGKGTVGIEVPNSTREIVRLRDIIECKDFTHPDNPLALAIGKDTFGDPYITDLARMPHLLIAGATGTGKSVCINSMLLSLLYRSTPEELRLIMIDPKMLELSIYEGIPHLKAPVVTNPKRARGVLWWAVEEMERRYRLMKDLGVRNLAGYNKIVGAQLEERRVQRTLRRTQKEDIIELSDREVVATAHDNGPLEREAGVEAGGGGKIPIISKSSVGPQREPLPRIVIVVDELADLMLTVGREIEELLTRLAQKARAAGIHLILATQRPSVNVITGLIKANFPARVSFQVASRIDARTVMDTSGAERLLGQGDMLFMEPGTGRVRRLHSAFVSDKEVQDVVAWLREQGAPDYDTQIETMIEKIEQNESGGTLAAGEEVEIDPFYDQAVRLVVDKGAASTSMVQRVFRIGYNRAARMLETMEREGIVGPPDGAKRRQVLVPNREDRE